MSDYENNYDSGVVGEAGVTNSADWWPEVGPKGLTEPNIF